MSFRPLPGDLARPGATPAFSFIAPDLCNDGHCWKAPVSNSVGQPVLPR